MTIRTYLLAPLRGKPITAGLFALTGLWLALQVTFDTSPLDRDNLAPTGPAQDQPPPRPPTSIDSGEAKMLDKAQWVVSTLRSANRAQMCGLRGHMWATRMEDVVFNSEAADRDKFRKESSNYVEFDDYADALREWEIKHIHPPHPSEYDCANMARSPEIDLLSKTDAQLKAEDH